MNELEKEIRNYFGIYRNRSDLEFFSKNFPAQTATGFPFISVIRSFVIALKPEIYLEIGIGSGITLGVIALVLKDIGRGKAFGIDILENSDRKKFWEIIEVQDIIHEIIGDSKEVVKNWNYGEIDILFIDGDHTRDGFENDFRNFFLKEKVKRGGMIFCHDLNHPGIYSFFEENCKNFDFYHIPIFEKTEEDINGFWIVKKY